MGSFELARSLALTVYDAFHSRSDAQRAAKQKEAKERELEHAAFSADRIEEGGTFPMSMVSTILIVDITRPERWYFANRLYSLIRRLK